MRLTTCLLSLALVIVAYVVISQARTCSYACYKTTSYKFGCSFWSWSRCTHRRYFLSVCHKPCDPVNGAWSRWSIVATDTCSATCGPGKWTVTRRRTCTNPAPQYGGANCVGPSSDTMLTDCLIQPCPVNGAWSSWSIVATDTCSATCGSSKWTVTSRRTCTNPAPQYGGANCVGSSSNSMLTDCIIKPCPVDGGWSFWGSEKQIGSCSVSCGGGKATFQVQRSCTVPPPAHGGRDCVGNTLMNITRACNPFPCPGTLHCNFAGQNIPHRNTSLYYECDANLVPHELFHICRLNTGFREYKGNCTLYLRCALGLAYVMSCNKQEMWNQTLKTCVHKDGSC